MDAAGEKKEAPVLRTLIDEALAARRRKSTTVPAIEQPSPELAKAIERTKVLLNRMVAQSERMLQAHDVSLGLLQEVLAEATISRRIVLDRLEVPYRLDHGVSSEELAQSLREEIDSAKDLAYELAAAIGREHSHALDESEEAQEALSRDDRL